jgi:hypothetical protein
MTTFHKISPTKRPTVKTKGSVGPFLLKFIDFKVKVAFYRTIKILSKHLMTNLALIGPLEVEECKSLILLKLERHLL